MRRLIPLLLLIAAFAGCAAPAPTGQVWRASNTDGDKPGLGYELRIEDGKIMGAAYIIDAEHPHDFSHGRRAEMRIVDQSPAQITFRVHWSDDLKATLRFEFKDAVWPEQFQAVVSEMEGSEPVDTETFAFSRVH